MANHSHLFHKMLSLLWYSVTTSSHRYAHYNNYDMNDDIAIINNDIHDVIHDAMNAIISLDYKEYCSKNTEKLSVYVNSVFTEK